MALFVRTLVIATVLIQAGLALKSTGRTVELDNKFYYVPPQAVGSIPDFQKTYTNHSPADDLIPLTILQSSTPDINAAAATANWTTQDDVFSPGFLSTIYIQCTTNTTSPSPLPPNTYISQASPESHLPAGPYFLSPPTGTIFQAYLLETDFAGAFTETLISDPSSPGSYITLPANLPGQNLALALPSRLYFTPSPSKPLAGVRVGIKDIFDVNGTRKSNGNRAYYSLYPPATSNALVVQKLIDAGAVIVGKMATSQFANGELATADWVDYHSPFNPRGDGYQEASSSSAGAGAGVASYGWLDLALGSDTGGSVRGPAQVGGVFGNRPTHGLVELTGAMPLGPELDTAGLLARDPRVWAEAGRVVYRGNVSTEGEREGKRFPGRLLAYGFPKNVSKDGDALLIEFLGKVSGLLGVKGEEWDLDEEWGKGHEVTLRQLLNTTYATIIGKRQTRLLRDPFYRDYAAAHDGRRPFVDPVPFSRWAFADSLPDSALNETNANRTIFADWFASEVVAPDQESCSKSLLLYVGSQAKVTYRNIYRLLPSPPFDVDMSSLVPFWGGPDVVVPIGSAKYFSNITQHEELLPVTVDMVAARGCDGMLYDLVQALFNAGAIKASKAGYSENEGGEVLMRREMRLY